MERCSRILFCKMKFTVYRFTICTVFTANSLICLVLEKYLQLFQAAYVQKRGLYSSQISSKERSFPLLLDLSKNRGVIESYQLFIPETNIPISTVCLTIFWNLIIFTTFFMFSCCVFIYNSVSGFRYYIVLHYKKKQNFYF